jgi:prepilin-type N-terminal cleavage/methylation domain-containing protein
MAAIKSDMMKIVKRINKARGFTLVELLVVIAIMSILTVITAGQFQQAQWKARDVQRKSNLDSLSKAIQMYYADLGTLPAEATINGLLATGGELKDDSGYVYMKVVPKESINGMPAFCYELTGNKYGLFTGLENKEDSDCNDLNDHNKNACDSSTNYSCGGSNSYNFVILSPNASIGDV